VDYIPLSVESMVEVKKILLGTSNNPFLCGVIRVTVVIWVVSWVSFQKRRC